MGIQLYWYGKRQGLIVILYYFKYAIYCKTYQHLAKGFTLYSVNHKNKQTTSVKGKSQYKFNTFYIHVLKTLENLWNNPNNGIELHPCKASSYNSSSIFFAYQSYVDLVLRIQRNTFLTIFINLLKSFLSILFLKKERLKV